MAQKIICRPCKRRLDRAIQFKRLIVQTQKLLKQCFRTKLFVEISPSVKSCTGCTVRASASSSSGQRLRNLEFIETIPTTLQVSYVLYVTAYR